MLELPTSVRCHELGGGAVAHCLDDSAGGKPCGGRHPGIVSKLDARLERASSSSA